MVKPSQSQLAAAVKAGRQALENYSHFDSSMVPDAALETFCVAVLTAALNVPQPTAKGVTPNA